MTLKLISRRSNHWFIVNILLSFCLLFSCESQYLVVIYVQELVDDGLWLPLDLLFRQSRSVRGLDWLRFHCRSKNNNENGLILKVRSVTAPWYYLYLNIIFMYVSLTRLPDSAALRLCFVLGDTRSSGLGSLSLPVSSRLICRFILQQLLGTASPDEQSGPWRRRAGDQRLLAALPPWSATTDGEENQTSKWVSRDGTASERLTTRSTKILYLPRVLLESKSGFCGGVVEGWGEGVDCSAE